MTKCDLLSLLQEKGVKCGHININKHGDFSIECNTAADVDVLFSRHSVDALKARNCEPKIPPDIQSKRTVFIKRVDHIIYDHDVKDIKSEIETQNSWLKIRDIYKFSNSKTLKTFCESQEMAAKCVEKGLLMFNLIVTQPDVSLDNYVSLEICFRCYQWDNHKLIIVPKTKSLSCARYVPRMTIFSAIVGRKLSVA